MYIRIQIVYIASWTLREKKYSVLLKIKHNMVIS